MGIFDRFRRERRASPENPTVPVSASNFLSFFGVESGGEPVTIRSALSVPAFGGAVNFLAGTLAGLPLHVYSRSDDGRKRVSGKLAGILHDAANDETSSFDWRYYVFSQVFTEGRGVTFIERNEAGSVINLWPLMTGNLKVDRVNGRKTYTYRDAGKALKYDAADVIDIPFMLKPDGVGHYAPVALYRDTLAHALAVKKYGAKFFDNGGVPPFMIEGPFASPGAMQRAADDLAEAVRKASKEKRQALVLPAGHTVKQIGLDAEKSQLVETQRFLIEEVARIFGLPPTFLQDLTHGTFSNTEQQDLHFVKHTLKRWVEQFEQEINLKIFGRTSNRAYAEMNVDGLLRGDFKTRMEGYAQGIQNAILAPNEARSRENLPAKKGGDDLLIQGATVPLGAQPAPTQGGSNGA